jgi:hypothetical protein
VKSTRVAGAALVKPSTASGDGVAGALAGYLVGAAAAGKPTSTCAPAGTPNSPLERVRRSATRPMYPFEATAVWAVTS